MSSHHCQATDWDGALLGQEYQLVNVVGQGMGLGQGDSVAQLTGHVHNHAKELIVLAQL